VDFGQCAECYLTAWNSPSEELRCFISEVERQGIARKPRQRSRALL
jgi:hypothetical protein